jgi:hypothetical protein
MRPEGVIVSLFVMGLPSWTFERSGSCGSYYQLEWEC